MKLSSTWHGDLCPPILDLFHGYGFVFHSLRTCMRQYPQSANGRHICNRRDVVEFCQFMAVHLVTPSPGQALTRQAIFPWLPGSRSENGLISAHNAWFVRFLDFE